MRKLLSVAVLIGVAASSLAADDSKGVDPKPVTPAEAIRGIGKPVVVEFTVRAVKDRLDRRGALFLDSEADFKHPDNLGVALSAEAVAGLKARGVADVAAHFRGKTVRVKGCVMRFEERPYLPVHDPDRITVVPGK